MNYIKHLNYWHYLVEKQNNVRPSHISLYLALFQLLNRQGFSETIYANRSDVMVLAKIGSKSTYANCMSDLHNWGWLRYCPSHSIYTKSSVRLKSWGSTGDFPTSKKQPTPPLGQDDATADVPVKKKPVSSKYHTPL